MIFNMVGGGGGSGATLVVSSPANVSVTVSKDDKSYTKNSGSLGSTTFKGLATGTWTVTISGNGQTATKTIEITADYAITIAFFSASINITYPANSNCVVTNSGGQTVASDTNTGSSTKTWTATVNATGAYTVTATATDGSGKTKSATVSITAAGQVESLVLAYRLYLYNYGDKCEDVTGGWEQYQYNGYGEGSWAYNSDNIFVNGVSVTNSATVVSMVSFDPNLLSQFSQLKYTVSVPEGAENKLVILANKPFYENIVASVDCNGVAGTYSISLDNISSGWPALFSYKGSQKVHAVWLE